MGQLRRLIAKAQAGRKWLIAVSAASGQSARCAAEAGADFLFASTDAHYRSQGVASQGACLPFANANDQVEDLLRRHVMPMVGGVPVVAAVLASDPTVELAVRLERLRNLGVAGVVNFPTISMFDGAYRRALEEAGMGLDSELALLQQARNSGFVTFAGAFTADDAQRFAAAGVDAVVLNIGLTRQIDDIHERRERLQHMVVRLNAMLASVAQAGRTKVCLMHGGPITAPEDLEEVFRHSSIRGFAGGPVFDRLPVESIITSTVRRFKGIAAGHGKASDEVGLEQIVGRSAVMRDVFRRVRRIAPYDVNVCLHGESGTGKELVATQIHRLSHRARHAFVTLNCGAIPESLLESELFGHEKGAFTGADRRRLGKFELAHQGTLFLDEIADLSPRGQVALLRAIQQREIDRVGGETPVPADVRIVSASSRNLADLVRANQFRADLFYRLSNVTISIPPLRDRQDDIPLLVETLLTQLQSQLDRKLVAISPKFHEKLQRHGWPGNVRELQHVVLQAALLEDGPVLKGEHFIPTVQSDALSLSQTPAAVESPRKIASRQAVIAAGGNKSLAAKSLGITRKTLYLWLNDSN
ncbi:MAG: phosphoenolpyruvate hydrolase family protein [Planctomycetaceae bacterium]